MKKAFLAFFILLSFSASAQSRYIVKLKDKGSNPFSISNPSAYLGERALQRRSRYSIPIDSLDLPVTPRYLDSILNAGSVIILNTSKWLNQVAIRTSDAQALLKISNFPFVTSISVVGSRNLIEQRNKFELETSEQEPGQENSTTEENNFYDYGLSYPQVRLHNNQFLHNHNFRGKGMLMAVLDAGFFNYLTHPTFDSVRNNGQIKGTWDFVMNEASVNEDNNHGMQCFSTIAANMPGVFVGQAPETDFYLFRTEDVGSEYPIEEQNWAAGMERSDSLGVDITSTSLGYYRFDDNALSYQYSDMDGNTTISARAADIAAKKGMMVIVAVGNEGNNSWHYLITPSDADSCVAVGAVDSLGNPAGFSSYGPSPDGRVKPDLAAVGSSAVVANTFTGLPVYGNGTSFACPNLAGITTCLWQAYPEVNNMQLIDVMKRSANRYSNPDDRTGYGIPDMKKSFVMLQKQLSSQAVSNAGCTNNISLQIKMDNSMSVAVERKRADEDVYSLITTFTTQNSFHLRLFSFDDDLSSEPAGVYQYRYRVDIGTDTSYYLDSSSVVFAGECVPAGNNVVVYPNPVSENLNIIIARTSNAGYEVVLHNSAGQRVYRKTGVQNTGTGVININTSAFSKGVYYLTVYLNREKAFTKKIIRQ